jgi:methylmalonyl-CoA/ethylmalonyl-CoA epimerase
VAQQATDLERAAAFYQRLLGRPPIATFDPPGLVFFDLEGTRLLLDRVAPKALLYLYVDDLTAMVERLQAEGVEVTTQPHVIFADEEGLFGQPGEDEWMAFFEDSEGNQVGLASRR